MTDEKTKLDLTQRLERKLAACNISKTLWKRWLFEILSLLVSMSCMTALIIIYVVIKNKPLAELGYLLSFANILGKVASAALIVPTTEALGQLKWNWFHESNAMYDFEIFDKATRGPLGAAMLLYRTKGRSLAALGAMLILLLLAIDSFLQQVVELPERWYLTAERGMARRTIRYAPDIPAVFSEGYPMIEADGDLKNVLKKFFYGNGTQPVPYGNATKTDLPIACPTGNCTWPVYDTFGVCSQCEDVSDYLTYACKKGRNDWTSDLMGGYRTEASYANMTMCGYFLNLTVNVQTKTLMSGYTVNPNTSAPGEALVVRTLPMLSVFDKTPVYGNGSIRFPHVRDPIADSIIVSAADGTAGSVYRHEKPIAQECVLTWCVKTIASSYNAGAYQEEILKTHTNTTDGPFPWKTVHTVSHYDEGVWINYLDQISIEINTNHSTTSPRTYGTDNNTAYAIMTIFDDIFPSFYTAPDETTEPMLHDRQWTNGPAYLRKMSFNPWNTPNNVSTHLARLASAMTDRMRSAGLTNEEVEADAYDREVYVRVRWAWLAFPIALLLLSLAFLVATIWKTADTGTGGIWKTSAMPTLIYGLPKEAQDKLNSSQTWSSTDRGRSKKVRIRLLPNLGWRVSGLPSIRKNQPPPGWI